MSKIVVSNSDYSTTRTLYKAEPARIAAELKTACKKKDTFKTLLFLPEGKGRQGEGGLRTQGYFKKSCANQPLITVVTVVFNGEQFIEETILSVINQTYHNVEYIIIDGGSTDATLDVVRKYEHAIDYWVSEKDSGIYDAMNKGIDLATGNWINFMNAGDTFFEQKILYAVFNGSVYKNVDVLYGNHQIIYPSGRKCLVKAGNIKNLWKGSQFCHQASFIRSSYHKQHKFNLCIKIAADFNFFYAAQKNQISFNSLDQTIATFKAGGFSDKIE